MNLNQLLTKLNPFAKKEEVVAKPNVLEVIDGVEITDEPPEPINNHKKKNPMTEIAKAGEHSNYKLSESDKQIIVSLWASGLTSSEVVERVREEHNIIISHSQVTKYAHAEKWQPLIKKIRQVTMNDLAAVAGSHKRVRLERHEKVYDKAIKKGDLKHALAATENQRKEMEGGGDVNFTLNQFNMLSDDELEAKKAEVLQKIQLMSKQKGALTIEQPTA